MPGDVHAVLARRVDRERAPAAADVEHALARPSGRACVQTSSSLVRCASSSVCAPREKIAHEYVIDSSRKSEKNSLERL